MRRNRQDYTSNAGMPSGTMKLEGGSGRLAKAEMAAATTLFGTVGIFTKFIQLPSSVILMFRGVIGTLFLILIIYILGKRVSRDDIHANALVLIASGIFLSLDWLFVFEAYKVTAVSTATLCNSLSPAFLILLSPIFLKEKLTPLKVVCVSIAILGLCLISKVFDPGAITASDAKGIVLGVASAVSFTIMILLNKKLRGIGPYDRTLVQVAVATTVVIAYCAVAIDFGSLTFRTIDLGLLVLMGFLHLAVTFTLYYTAIGDLNAQTVAIYAYIEPVVALVLSLVILGENPGIAGWVGAAMILGSMITCELVDMRKALKGRPPRRAVDNG